MPTHRGEEDPEPEPINLTLSVWTPTAEEAATLRRLEDRLAEATTTELFATLARESTSTFERCSIVTATIRHPLQPTLAQMRR